MDFPTGLFFTKDHEWASEESNVVTVGITDHAQEALGEIVFLEVPEIGRQLKTHEAFGVVESIKAVSDLYSPIGGTVVEVNSKAVEDPSSINNDPYKAGWLIKLKPSDPKEISTLMNTADYKAYVESLK
ncbi:MAG: glycine cleavage system protein GcvH [Bacteriovoracia bacterium]